MSRLTARSLKNNQAYLLGIRNDEQEVEGTKQTLLAIKEAFEKLADYEDKEETK